MIYFKSIAIFNYNFLKLFTYAIIMGILIGYCGLENCEDFLVEIEKYIDG